MSINTVHLYDTTLRDGAQGEGINFSVADKLRIAQRLDHFGVAYIEGGWQGSNDKDIEFFSKIRDLKLKNAKMVAFGSTRRAKVPVAEDPQVRLLLEAETPTVTIFGKTWLLHVLEVLRTSPEENLAMIHDTVAHLKAQGREVIYDAEHCFDGYKDNQTYALDCLKAAAAGGADYLVLCDTNGGTLPSEVGRITQEIRTALGGMPIGIHTHDDSGLGAANALAAVEAGAVQVQGTINGYGERTGNCNLISVLPNLQLKMGHAVVTPEQLAQLQDLSLFVDEVANQRPSNRAPFVGASAFAHKGGTHVNAVNKVARSFEHIVPELVGNRQRVLVGELSGRTNVMIKAKELGLALDEKSPEAMEILNQIKTLENQGYEFESADASFELLVRKVLQHHRSFFDLVEYHVSVRTNTEHKFTTCEATVKLLIDGQVVYTVGEGDGPVNALDAALRRALVSSYPQLANLRLTDYKVRIIDSQSGTAAKTRVLIESSDGHASWGTVGVSENIIDASWHALVDSVEFHLFRQEKKFPGIKPTLA
jgi:2-isopropylmalate synthase